MWRASWAVYLVLLHLLVAVLLMKTNFIDKLQARLSPDVAATHPFISETLIYYRWQQPQIPEGATVFIGDSLTQGLVATRLSADAVNFGVGHINTRQLLKALPEFTALPRAGAIVLTIGINDFIVGLQDGIDVRLAAIVEALPPAVPLIWNGILPARYAGIDPLAMQAANRTIESLCAQRGNCRYVDTWPVLADAEGRANPDDYLADGLHLNAQGYERWIALLRAAMQ